MTRLVQGITDNNGGVKQYTGPTSSGGAVNYCDIVVNNYTGQVKTVRP
jgi:hypothetical protein